MNELIDGRVLMHLLGAAAVLAATAAGAQTPALPGALTGMTTSAGQSKNMVTPRLISEHTTLVPGTTANLALTFDVPAEWHIYWNGRSDSGTAPTAEWTLPSGFTVGTWLWPAPKRYISPGEILDHIYEGRVTLIVPVRVPKTAKAGTSVTISAELEWLVCKDVCISETGKVSITLPIAAAGSEPKASAEAKLFAATRGKLPRAAGSDVVVEMNATTAKVRVAGASGLTFYPEKESVEFIKPIADCDTSGDALSMRLVADKGSRTKLQGVLEIRRKDKPTEFVRIDAAAGGASGAAPNKPARTEKRP